MSWSAWKWDLWTVLWLTWILAFFVLETWTLVNRSHNELTAHLRPLIQSAPPVWFVALGLWAWVLVHFFVQGMDWKALFRVG
jgi:hypothetical protein